jgi:hypothetical protein
MTSAQQKRFLSSFVQIETDFSLFFFALCLHLVSRLNKLRKICMKTVGFWLLKKVYLDQKISKISSLKKLRFLLNRKIKISVKIQQIAAEAVSSSTCHFWISPKYKKTFLQNLNR